MAEAVHRPNPDRAFLSLLVPLTAASLPSVVFCALVLASGLHGLCAGNQIVFQLPPHSLWDRLFILEARIYEWLTRWNSVATLAASAFFVFTLFRRRWRAFSGLALIPYGVLLCADFAMRWHNTIP
ncbi:MAG TPA: hypothetical protein VIY53_17450 [Acidobacteriaceae bacterium]